MEREEEETPEVDLSGGRRRESGDDAVMIMADKKGRTRSVRRVLSSELTHAP